MTELKRKFLDFPGKLEKGLCYAVFIFLVLMPAAEVIARFLQTGIPASASLINQLLLAAGLLAGMLTTKSGEHLSVALVYYVKNERAKTILAVVTGLVSVLVVTIIFWCSLSFFLNGLTPGLVGFIPVHLFGLVVPLGYGVIALRFARLTPLKGKGRLLTAGAFILGTFCAFPSLTKIFWGLDAPDSAAAFSGSLYLAIEFFQGPAIIFLVLAALAGTPLFVVIGGVALIILQASGGQAEAVPIQIYTALTDSSIVAIPLFTLTGFFLSESKAGERLVHAFRSLCNWLPGGMIIATVIICAFFTSFTGASGVTILALGGVLYTILSEKSSYPDKFSIGLLTSAGGIGLLFPPSLPIILVGVTSRTNIIHVFLGAIIPGIVLVAVMIVFGISASIKIKIPVERFDAKKALLAIRDSALEILLPFFLIGGYFTGILSLVEIGAVSVIYVFIVEVLIHRDIKVSEVRQVFFKAIPIIGGVLSILALAKALSYGIVFTQVPDNLAIWMVNTIESRWIFLLLLNLVLLVVGCLMDIFSAILVVLPLIVPLGEAYGIDPVHLGVIFIMNLEVGFLTPPVGLNLFLASYRFKKPFTVICRYVWPFLLIQLVVVLLVTYIPALSTWLPGLVSIF
ncbi:MAG: TRAP transporter large permease subunit [Treponema sp.]|jgi:tripartite ATP-independent transporter DctM subunit|nr:TRAP transporter large permease subunit [Treponema sp.]